MEIGSDKDIFTLARLISSDGYDDGVRVDGAQLLCRYWKENERIPHICALMGGDLPRVSFEALPYLMAIEDVCEELDKELSFFLKHTVSSSSKSGPDVAVNISSRELVKSMESFCALRHAGDWEAYYKRLLKATTEIILCISQLNAYKSMGKTVCFTTNICALDLLSSKINFTSKSGKHFLLPTDQQV
ncbi:MAG: hypothetical protein IJ309_02065 [Clostridia bacterium]|nr:hypothetical protein [Clostridia bacterium]